MAEFEQEPLPGLGPAVDMSAITGSGRRRKPGAQPGNTNALRHGFYSRRFRCLEKRDLENGLQDGLRDEISLLRVQIRRLVELAEGQTDLKEAIQSLTAIGLACTRLANMLKTQHMLHGEDSGITQAINGVVDDILKDWKR
jgi:hypothetical protein